ncbi:hypothetical protein [Mycobacterium tuberculosis]
MSVPPTWQGAIPISMASSAMSGLVPRLPGWRRRRRLP